MLRRQNSVSDRRHDAYAEKLRRSVEAVQEYNAGQDDSEQLIVYHRLATAPKHRRKTR